MPGDACSMYRVMSDKEIKEMREYYPAAVGGSKIASTANDKEIEFLINVNDDIAVLSNRIFELQKMKNNILKSIEKSERSLAG